MRSKYGNRVTPLMTDTDNIVYHIQTYMFADIMEDLDDYDTSDYPPDHPAYSDRNKKVLGKMKNEYNGPIVVKFLGLDRRLKASTNARATKHRCISLTSKQSLTRGSNTLACVKSGHATTKIFRPK